MMFNVTRSFACVFSSALYAELQARPTLNKKPNRMVFRVVIGLFSWSIALLEVYCLLSLTASALHRSTAQECDSNRGLVRRKISAAYQSALYSRITSARGFRPCRVPKSASGKLQTREPHLA